MSDESSAILKIFTGAFALIATITGWNYKRIDNLTQEVSKCKNDHIKINDFREFKEGLDKRFDKVDDVLEYIRRKTLERRNGDVS